MKIAKYLTSLDSSEQNSCNISAKDALFISATNFLKLKRHKSYICSAKENTSLILSLTGFSSSFFFCWRKSRAIHAINNHENGGKYKCLSVNSFSTFKVICILNYASSASKFPSAFLWNVKGFFFISKRKRNLFKFINILEKFAVA